MTTTFVHIMKIIIFMSKKIIVTIIKKQYVSSKYNNQTIIEGIFNPDSINLYIKTCK